MTQLKRNQQLLRTDATSPRGVHLNYFCKYTPLGRETNCIPRRGQSACNYATSHNSDRLPLRGSIVPPSLHDDRHRHRLSSMGGDMSFPRILPVRMRRNERTCKSRFVQTTSRYTGAARVGRARCSFSAWGYPANFFVLLYFCARRSVGAVPTFSNVLRRSSARSLPTDRWNLDGNLGCFKPSHTPRFLLASLLHTVISTRVLHVK